jgi:CdiI N-terminal domain
MTTKQFSIRFTSEEVSAEDLRLLLGVSESAYGELVLGSHRERFLTPFSFWNKKRYRNQWKEGLRRLVTEERSCLITAITDPSKSACLTWWPMYRLGDQVHIQNHLLIYSDLPTPFDQANPYAHIPERETVSESGEKISEWTVSLRDIQAFLNSR